MKVLGLNPPSRYTKNLARDLLWGCWCKGKRIAGVQFPPLPLLFCGTILKQEGNEFDLIDAPAVQMSFEELHQKIKAYDAVFLISATVSYTEDAQTLLDLKKINPRLITIVFGSHPTFKPLEALEHPGVDIIVRREAEFVIRDLFRGLNQGGDSWKKVLGIGYREGKEKVVNDFYPFIKNLDEVPIPDRTFLPKNMEYYNPIIKRIPATTALSSRGCPSLCTYCTAPSFYGPKYRARSPENVLKEIEILTDMGYKEIFYRDELFTVLPRRVKAICEGIIARKLDVSWICSVKIGSVDKETLKLMKEAGCHMIRIGVETGNQELLDRVKKYVEIEQIRETFAWTHEIGLDTHAHMMLGMPGETKETIKNTFQFIEEIQPTTITYGITTPYPGTPLYDEVIQLDPSFGDGSQIDARTIHTQSNFSHLFTQVPPEELPKYIKKAYQKFYCKPSYVWKWMKRIRNIEDLRRLTMAGVNVFDFALRGE